MSVKTPKVSPAVTLFLRALCRILTITLSSQHILRAGRAVPDSHRTTDFGDSSSAYFLEIVSAVGELMWNFPVK
jgi:hypothetical protein